MSSARARTGRDEQVQRGCVCACACVRVCVRVAVEGEDLIHQLIRRNLRFGQLQHVQLDHGVGDRLGRERAKLARPNRPSTTQRRPLQRFKPISAREGGEGGGGRRGAGADAALGSEQCRMEWLYATAVQRDGWECLCKVEAEEAD